MNQRYHVRPQFWLAVLLSMLVVLAAATAYLNPLFLIGGVMVAITLITGLAAGAMLSRGRVQRLLPTHGQAGEALIIGYAVTNRHRLVPMFDLTIDELDLDVDEGAPRHSWIMHAGPGETVHGELTHWPHHRGVLALERMRISTSFPFGLIGASRLFNQPRRLLIHPRRYTLRRGLLERLVRAGAVGMTVTPYAGAGDDYYGLREYRPGDSMRRIAWKRTANRDELVCIERTRPHPPRIRVVLNLTAEAKQVVSRDEDPEAARDYEERAISLAASFVHAADLAGYEIGLSVLGTGEPPIPVRRGHWHRNRLMAALAEIDLEATRRAGEDAGDPEAARTAFVIIHPGAVDPSVARSDAMHVSARHLEHLVETAPAPVESAA